MIKTDGEGVDRRRRRMRKVYWYIYIHPQTVPMSNGQLPELTRWGEDRRSRRERVMEGESVQTKQCDSSAALTVPALFWSQSGRETRLQWITGLSQHKRITVEGLVSLLSKNNRFLTSGQVTANMDALLKHISVVILDFTVEKRQDQNGLFWMSGSDLAR